MRRFRDIIEDIKAPSIQNLWLNGGKLKYYGENGWQDIKGYDTPTVKWDDIEDKPDIPPAYSLPNASASTRGGVLMAAAVTDLTGTENAAAICTKVNALLSSLRTAGILIS